MAKKVSSIAKHNCWKGGELDCDPFALPQSVTVPANRLVRRMMGFIRYATVDLDGVRAADSSPILGLFEWREPLSAYQGVAMRVAYRNEPGFGGERQKPVILVELRHRSDSAHSLVLHASFDGSDVAARWRSWGRVLGLPLLLEDNEGSLRDAERRLGALLVDTAQPHSRANPLTRRRPLAFGFTGRPRLPQRLCAKRPGAYQAVSYQETV